MEEKILELEKRITNIETKMKKKEEKEKRVKIIKGIMTIVSVLLVLVCVLVYYSILMRNISSIMGGL